MVLARWLLVVAVATAVLASVAVPAAAQGYRVVALDGTIRSFGDGSPVDASAPSLRLSPIVCAASTPTNDGYWLLTADGSVLTFGGAAFYGTAAPGVRGRFVAMGVTPTGRGYWLVSATGGVFSFGDAAFFGSAAGRLSAPLVAMAPTPSGNGYWLTSSDGGVFAFGDAPFLGSMADVAHNGRIVGIAPTTNGKGYWLASSDGGVFAFGDAPFLGSMAGSSRAAMVAITATTSGGGYRLLGTDGGVFSFGDAVFEGSAVGSLRADAVGLLDSGRSGCSASDDQTLGSRATSASAYAAGRAGSAGFAIVDARNGEILGNPAGSTVLRSASIVKVIIGMALLARAERLRRPLTTAERRDLGTMIRASDNNAASRLWDALGGPAVIDWLRRSIGVRATQPPAVTHEWGSTTTDAHDMALVLDTLVRGHVIGIIERRTLLDEMRSVVTSQRWGIADAAHGRVALKNGWYLDSDPSDWRVHCLGVVPDAAGADRWLISVMTTYPAALGIAYGQATCRAIATRLLGPAQRD